MMGSTEKWLHQQQAKQHKLVTVALLAATAAAVRWKAR